MKTKMTHETVLADLREQLDPMCFKDVEPRYLEDPRGIVTGHAAAVLAPGTAQDVSAIVRAANAARVPVVPYGGGTGLVGGQIKGDDPAPLVISLERMNRIRDLNQADGTATVEAGVILQTLRDAADDVDRLFPLSLASQGSCQIGGNLATNAGGVNVLRYGNMRDLCLGLEAVLPNGDIWHGLKRLRKDNTGYDLRNLLIGAEGSLGIITAASLRLFPKPVRNGAALIVVPSPAAALALLGLARDYVGDTISAFELIDGTGLDFLRETMPEIRQPFETTQKWSVLIDLGVAKDVDPDALLETLFIAAADAGLASDGVVAQSGGQRADFWTLRESIPVANKRVGSVSSHDISVPIGSIDQFISTCSKKIGVLGDYRINSFGHLGDGNLHFNVFPAEGQGRPKDPDVAKSIRNTVYETVAEFDGSFSAEHGIGRLKTKELERYVDPTKRAAMQAIKLALDPNGIMNPGVILG